MLLPLVAALSLVSQPTPAPPASPAPATAAPPAPASATGTAPAAPATPLPATPPPAAPPAAPPPAEGVRGCTLAVLDLEAGDGVRRERAQAFTDVVTGEVGALSPCSVLSRSDVRGVLSFEAEKQLLGCTQESCLAELAGALGADLLVTGSLSKIEASMLLSLRVTDLKSLKVTRRATDSFAGEDDDAIAFVAWLTRKLMSDDVGKIGEKPKGTRKNVMIERKQTLWRTLAWTSLLGTGLAASSAAVFGFVTTALSDQTRDKKATLGTRVEDIQGLTDAGPLVADVANGSLYASGALLLITIPLFFLPAEELVEVPVARQP